MICTPKPKHLTIKNSPWYGQTIITEEPIIKGKVIAMTLVENYDRYDGHFNTPFGVAFNSTDDVRYVNIDIDILNGVAKIIAKRDIKAGEELLFFVTDRY